MLIYASCYTEQVADASNETESIDPDDVSEKLHSMHELTDALIAQEADGTLIYIYSTI